LIELFIFLFAPQAVRILSVQSKRWKRQRMQAFGSAGVSPAVLLNHTIRMNAGGTPALQDTAPEELLHKL
jgi:hypothetical protein